MRQLVQNKKTGEFQIIETPMPTLRRGGILVEVMYSLVSTGTERGIVLRNNPSMGNKIASMQTKASKALHVLHEDGIAEVARKVRNSLTPDSTWGFGAVGYSVAGKVISIAPDVSHVSPGDVVACGGVGFANHAEIVFVPKHLAVRVPDGVSPDVAAFGTVGAIALHGFRQSKCRLGETVVVLGLGLVGLLTVQIAKAGGCQVIGIDLVAERCKLALELGADFALPRETPDLIEQIHAITGWGADSVIICAATNSNDPVELAGYLCRDRGRVVALGNVGLNVPREIYYRKEIELIQSRSYGPGRYDPMYEEKGNDYPIGYVRWTEQRNLAAFLNLVRTKRVTPERLISHRISFSNAPKVYELLRSGQGVLAILLEYPTDLQHKYTQFVRTGSLPRKESKRVSLGVIGAGAFSRGVLLPAILSQTQVAIRAVASASGLSARSVAEKYQIPEVVDTNRIFEDPTIDAVVVATRHDSHAEMVIRALRSGKAVFVEKPLALTEKQLDQIIQYYSEAEHPSVMVGFNRRFAPMTQKLKEFFATVPGPKVIIYRVNAGFLPPDHWLQIPEIGGGRLIGEGCHFIDWMRYIVSQPVVHVSAGLVSGGERYADDNFVATIKFADGSLGTLIYTSAGNGKVPKERIEVHSGARTAILVDFKRLDLFSGKRQQTFKGKQDKGHHLEIAAWVAHLQQGGEEPIPFADAVETTRVVFMIEESLKTGRMVFST